MLAISNPGDLNISKLYDNQNILTQSSNYYCDSSYNNNNITRNIVVI